MRHLAVLCIAIALGACIASLATAQEAELCGQVVNGRLCNVSRRVPSTGDVILDAMPSGSGPFKYDARTRRAVSFEDGDRTEAERLSRLAAPTASELAALFVLASDASDAAKTKARAVVNERARLVCEKAGW